MPGPTRSRSRLARRRAATAALSLLLFVPAGRAESGTADAARPRILILNSFNGANAYTQAQMRGIQSAFPPSDDAWSPFLFQDLDYHSRLAPEYEQAMVRALALRFEGQRLALVITTDTRALDFMIRHGSGLFPQVPVVFSAAYTPRDRIAGSGLDVTGVRETVDVRGTLEFILRLQPEVSRIVVVYSERSDQAKGFKDQALELAASLARPVKIDTLSPPTPEALATELAGLGPRTAVLYTAFLSSESLREQLPRVCAASAAPVYCLYDVYVGLGPIGGRVSSAELLGREAGTLAKRVLEGRAPGSIPVRDDAGLAYMVDSAQLARWKLDPALLPAGTVVRNAPAEFLERNRDWAVGLGIAVAVQSAVIGMLLISRRARRRAEAELRDQRARLEQAVIGSNVAIWDWDILAQRTVWPCGVPRFLDDNQPHNDPDFWSSRLHPDDRETALARLAAHLERDEPYHSEYRLRMSDGGYRWFRSRGRAVRDKGGRAVRMLGTLVDVHDRVVAQEHLVESEARFRNLTEYSEDYIVLIDHEGRRLYRSPATERVFGLSDSERTSTDLSLRVHPDDRAVAAAMHEAGRRGEHGRFELRAFVADGTLRWIDMLVAPVTGADGRVDTYICYGRDVTDRKHVELELERFFRLSLGMLCIADTDGYFKRVNPAFLTTLGYSEADLLSRPYIDFVHPEDRDRTQAIAAGLAVGDEVSGFENRYRCADGSYRRIAWRAALAADLNLIYASARDVTEERSATEALALSEAKYRHIVEIADEGVWVVDDSWRTTFVNARMASMLGLRPDDMLGRHLFEFMDERARAECQPNMSGRERGERAQHDFRLRHADGRDVWTLMSASPITDEQGRFTGALAMVTDITARRAAEEALRASQATNMALLGVIPDLVFRMDRDGRYLDYAGPAEAPLMVQPDDFLGRTAREVLPAERAEQCMQALGAVFTTGLPQTYEYEAGEGENIRSWEVRVVKAGADQALLLIRNISDRRRAEAALRHAEERYRSLVERLPLVVYSVPLDTAEPIYISPQFKGITGLPVERLLGGRAAYERHIHPEDRERVSAALRRARESGSSALVEYRVVRPDGRETWLREQVVTARNADGAPVSVQGLILDITATKKAEEALRDNQRRLALLIGNSPFGIIAWNTRFEITQWNPAAERIFGFTADEAIGRGADLIVPAHFRPKLDAIWRQLTSRQGGAHSINENLTKERGPIVCEWDNVAFYSADGSLAGVASFVHDVTQRVNADRRQALMMRELDHRVKNNMAAVLSLAEQTGRAARNFEEFHAAFSGRVRALSRLHTALARTHWKGADLRSILQQAVEPYSGNEPDRLSLDGPSVMLPPRVAQSLTMTVNELATNASKYGSLSCAGGRVHVQWSVAEGTDGTAPPTVTVNWHEHGGPVVLPPERRGFGMDLVEGAITYQLGGQVTFEFAQDGLRCRLVAPLHADEPQSAELESPAGGG